MIHFSAFVITGPSTTVASVIEILAGNVVKDTKGKGVAVAGQCLTDSFSITNQNTVPVICGTNTNYHGK